MTGDDRPVLITGGAGFIGSHLARRLLRRGRDVHVIDNLSTGNAELVPEGASFEEIDLRTEKLAERIRTVGPTEIVHLAAVHYVPYCNEYPEETFEVNVMGTRNLLTAARQLSGLQKVVYTSSAAVYPPRTGANSENSEVGPLDIYGRTKLIGEDLLRLYHAETATSAISARLFNVYGRDETNPHLIPAILDQVANGNRTIELGNLKPKRDFVHVKDVTRALVLLLEVETDEYQTYNVGTGQARSVREVAESVGTALGEEVRIEQDEDRVRESDRLHLEADITKIEKQLGWEPQVDFIEGLKDLLTRHQ